MKFGEFMAALAKGAPKHVYLLAGEEQYYIDRAERRILERLFPNGEGQEEGLQKLNGDMDMDELVGTLSSAPFFADKNVVLIRGSMLFKEKKSANDEDAAAGAKGKGAAAKKMDRLLAVLSNLPEYSYVIFTTTDKADKRRKIYKTIEKNGLVLEAEPVRAWNINDWLQGKLQSLNKEMDREAYAYFTGAVSMMQQISLGYLDQEFDKLALFSKERRIAKKDLAAVFSGLPEVSVFALTEAISSKDVKRAMMLLHRQVHDGAYLPLVLSLIVRHVRQLWQAKALMKQGYRGKALAKPLELNPFIAEKLGKAAESFAEESLKQAMLELADADYYLKTGQAGPEVLEHVLLGLCTSEKNFA